MISLLIADDEKVIRESLATCIDWKQMGINVVACCANGVDALDASIDHSPNIVLTDIKMPGLDGLELIRRIHAINEDTEFIILSGFREFDFAKQAIDLGVRQYLLKPISEEQIVWAVDDAIEYVAEKQKIRESMMQQTQLQRQLRRYYLQQLQYSLFLDHERFSETAAYYSEHFAAFDERFTLIRIRAISLEAACDLVPRLTSHINRDENNKITEFIYGQETLAAIVRSQAYHSAEEMQRLAGAAPLSLEPFDKLSTPALELRNALCCYSHIILIDSFGKISNLYSTSIAMDSVKNLPEDLVRLACDGQTDVWKRKLEQHLWNIRELHALRSSVAQIISGVLLKRGMQEDELPETSGIFNYVYQEQLPEALIDRAVQTIDAILEHQSQHSNELVNRVIAYVNRNLHDSSLSLKKIASDHVFVSVDYLSRLFVQETGERFSHYLNKLRVETAKQLLLQDSSRIYQVAERVGLGHNPRYFSQVFKKYTGCTPSEFISV